MKELKSAHRHARLQSDWAKEEASQGKSWTDIVSLIASLCGLGLNNRMVQMKY